jgi:hypothetical protein
VEEFDIMGEGALVGLAAGLVMMRERMLLRDAKKALKGLERLYVAGNQANVDQHRNEI